jgi:hypothetical protein
MILDVYTPALSFHYSHVDRIVISMNVVNEQVINAPTLAPPTCEGGPCPARGGQAQALWWAVWRARFENIQAGVRAAPASIKC